MFEGEGDKKKKGVSPLARYVGQEGYTLIIYILYDASLEDAYASFFL